jgi:DMSO/TMAO reductase YedYZ heme-binding membrane subunit
VATTRSRPRGRESARPSSGGVVAEHASKIYGVAIGGVIVIIAFLTLTSIGHVIDLAVQHFMLYYAGVFALIALCASVGLGLVSTDRMVLNPGHRVYVQSAHRAASFGALAFLVIHIVTEILAQRVHVIDAFVPFLSPFKTFYIGLGTISSDLIILLVITGILRKRFTSHAKAWRWRAIHYTSYVSFVFGVWHGLLGGRPGKPYVDWSYGFVVAFVAVGLAVRVLANSLRPKENLSAPPVSDMASSSSAPMRAAAMFAQAGMIRAAMPAAITAGSPSMTASAMTAAALPAAPSAYQSDDGRQPIYEPGYEGPPRYAGAPRDSGPLPAIPPGPPVPRAGSGPIPRAGTGPMPRPGTGPIPTAGTGPMPRAGTGPIPTTGAGQRSRAGTGSMPRAGAGPMRRAGAGPAPRPATGPMPRAATGGPGPRAGTGPMPRTNSGPTPMDGPVPGAQGSPRRPATGPAPVRHPGTGPMPRAGTGPVPRAGTGPVPRTNSGPAPRPATGPMPRAATGGPGPRMGTRPIPQGDAGWRPQGEQGNGQPPWDGGGQELDPSLRYREPGPGMPGYRGAGNRGVGNRGTGNRFRGGDDPR